MILLKKIKKNNLYLGVPFFSEKGVIKGKFENLLIHIITGKLDIKIIEKFIDCYCKIIKNENNTSFERISLQFFMNELYSSIVLINICIHLYYGCLGQLKNLLTLSKLTLFFK
jgi:hypothetical protein